MTALLTVLAETARFAVVVVIDAARRPGETVGMLLFAVALILVQVAFGTPS